MDYPDKAEASSASEDEAKDEFHIPMDEEIPDLQTKRLSRHPLYEATIHSFVQEDLKYQRTLTVSEEVTFGDDDQPCGTFLVKHQEEDTEDAGGKYGTWDGVFTSCLVNIFGVITFLRLGQVVGGTGVIASLGIIWVSTLLVLVTAISMSAVSTNGKVKAGGAYYLISRMMGPAVGGAVGFIYSIGVSFAVALNVVGCMETLFYLATKATLGKEGVVTGSVPDDMRLFGVIFAVLLVIACLIGVGWLMKIQIALLALIVAAIISFAVGAIMEAMKAETPSFVAQLSDNVFPPAGINDPVLNIITMFGIFFPGMTGIMAGANISGLLKDPSVAIPKGTIWAIGVSVVVYTIMVLLLGGAVASDNLQHNVQIIAETSPVSWLVYMGIFAATISSALACLIGAPRIFNPLAMDDLLPIIRSYKKTRADGDPVRATFIVFFIACAGIIIGNLDFIAPIVTCFYMMTYATINLACFRVSVTESPGWRPNFKWYNHWVAFGGALACLAIMFILKPTYGVITLAVSLLIYAYITITDPDVNWGSVEEVAKYTESVEAINALHGMRRHEKTYRPSYLLLQHTDETVTNLLRFVDSLKGGQGAVFAGNVVLSAESDFQTLCRAQERYIKTDSGALVYAYTVNSPTVRSGAQTLLQLAGVGSLKPNTVVLEYPENWLTDQNIADQFYGSVEDAFAYEMSVMICRGLDSIEFNDASPNPFGIIDIWWLVDDGGLSILIPYLMAKSKFWVRSTAGGSKKLPIRLCIVTEVENEQADFARLSEVIRQYRMDPMEIKTFRIESGVPSDTTAEHFEQTLRQTAHDEQFARPDRWLRVGELIHENSSQARLIYVTIPFTKPEMPLTTYMGILEFLSEDMPPCVLIRGNGKRVLTALIE
eukprot:4872_1